MFSLTSLTLRRVFPHNWKIATDHIHVYIRKKEKGGGKEKHELTSEYN